MKKKIVILLILVVFVAGLVRIIPKVTNRIKNAKIKARNMQIVEEIKEAQAKNEIKNSGFTGVAGSGGALDLPIPEQISVYLTVPFTPQSPYATEDGWDLHEESCEEAAVMQAWEYIQGTDAGIMDPAFSEKIILDMIDWQEENFGGHLDIYADKTKEFISGYYNYPADKISVYYDVDEELIKKLLSNGDPIIAPITGEILQNPYYPYPGYHMLTIIGYTDDNVITNDVGTWRGKDYSYSWDIFMTAMEDAGGDIVVIR